MDNSAVLFAKIAAIKKNFDSINYSSNGRTIGSHVEHLFQMYGSLIKQIKILHPELYSDIPDVEVPKPIGTSSDGSLYGKNDIDPLVRNLDYILEVRTHFRIGERQTDEQRKNSIFISHGRNKEWMKVQVYLEKDLNYHTIELAQQPNIGRTILQKLDEESDRCNSAIIIMTGDDIFENEIRARENVLHEIGFFQGKLGFKNIVLLHEEDVNIPSNIQGLVYIAFPKGAIETTYVALAKELKVIM